jgi:hypothetical protein
MKAHIGSLCLFGLLALGGCAGGTGNPIFNTAVKKAYIYAPGENKDGFGVPPIVVGATGEVRYCASGMAQLVQSRKKEALAAAADACGGEDKYAVMGEMMADATGSFMGVDVQCVGNAGRALVFKCLGAKPQPTRMTK